MSNDEEAAVEAVDPFSPENLPVIQYITLARIYDVLMALLAEQNPEAATDLLRLHMEGTLVGPQPMLNGQFITDLANIEQAESTAPEEN